MSKSEAHFHKLYNYSEEGLTDCYYTSFLGIMMEASDETYTDIN